MPFPSRPAFRSRLQTLSGDEVQAFVADLWTARGWSVQDGDDGLLVRRAGDAEWETVRVDAGESGDGAPDADILVITSASEPVIQEDTEILDLDDLYRQSKFALRRGDAARVVADHLDDVEAATIQQPAGNTESDSIRAVETGSVGDSSRDSRSPPAASAADLGDSDPDQGDGPDANESAASSDARWIDRRSLLAAGVGFLTGLGTTAGAFLVSPSVDESIELPGLSEDGVVDAGLVARNHSRVIEGASYTLALTLSSTDASKRLQSFVSMELDLGPDRTYLTRVATDGQDAPRFLGSPPAAAIFWSDGEVFLVTRNPEEPASFRQFQPPDGYVGTWMYWAWQIPFGGRFSSSSTNFVRRLFEAVPTRLVERRTSDGRTRYRVTDDGPIAAGTASLGYPRASNPRHVRLDAVLDREGHITSMNLRYRVTLDGEPVTIHRTLGYTDVGDTIVDRPDRIREPHLDLAP